MNEHTEILRLLNLALPRKRLHVKRKPAAKKVAIIAKSAVADEQPMSSTEARARLSNAVAHGTITGTDAARLEHQINQRGVTLELSKLLRGVS